jgi:peroxiredoxin Q/BCP
LNLYPSEKRIILTRMKTKLLLLVTSMSLFSLFAQANEGRKVEAYPAPKVEAMDQDGKAVKLEDEYKKAGFTLVYFYPKASTPGCTAQACSLRDAYESLTKAGVHVVGVSMDKVESQKKFSEKQHLPFTLLADPDGTVVKAFKVGSFLGFASRQAFLIKDGKVVWHDASASTTDQAADVLKAIKEF